MRCIVAVWTAVILTLVILCAAPAQADAAPLRAKVKTKFDAAVKSYRLGEYDKAAKILDELLALSPTSEEAWLLREKVGLSQLTDFLKHPDSAKAAVLLLRSAGKRDDHLRRDTNEIKKLVQQLSASSSDVRRLAIHKLVASGPFAVPCLLDSACSRETASGSGSEVYAMIALRKIGIAGGPPLNVALWNANDSAVPVIADLLANAGDPCAVPPLRAIIENPKRPEFIRKAAASALKQILKPDLMVPLPLLKRKQLKDTEKSAKPIGKRPTSASTAAGACADLAERFYYADTALIEIIPPKDRVVWSWSAKGKTFAENLTYKDVPTYAYPRINAHLLAFGGIEFAPDSMRLKELYASNNYMYLEDALAASDKIAEDLKRVIPLNESLGTDVIYDSLKRALKDNNPALARRCIESLRNIADPRPTKGDNSLVAALAVKDVSVSANAAETLMRVSPEGKLGGAKTAVDVIAVGLGARARPRIGVVTADTALSRSIAKTLNAMTLRSIDFTNIADALAKAKGDTRPLDALIIDTRTNAAGTPVIVKNIRADTLTTKLPLVLIAHKQDMEKLQAACAGQVTAIIPPNAEVVTIKSAMDQSLANARPVTPGEDIRKQAAIVRRVLAAIAALPPQTEYPVRQLADLIAKLTAGYPDDIRILALKALTRLNDSAYSDTAFALYATDTSMAVRQEAGKTFVALLAGNPKIKLDQRNALRALTKDADTQLADCAVRALAIADIPHAERKQHTITTDVNIPGLR